MNVMSVSVRVTHSDVYMNKCFLQKSQLFFGSATDGDALHPCHHPTPIQQHCRWLHKALSFCIQLNGAQSCVYQTNYFILQMLKAMHTLSPCEHIQQLKELQLVYIIW